MIRLQNIPSVQTVYIPKGVQSPAGAVLTLRFKSTVQLDTPLISVNVVDADNLKMYYVFNLAVGRPGDFNFDFNEDFFTWVAITPGEYEYTLLAGEVEIAHGIAIVGNYASGARSYGKEIQFKQYEG